MSNPGTRVTRDQARDAGMALCLLCFLAGATLHLRWLELAAMGVLVADMIAPALFRPFAVAWFGLAAVLGGVVSKVLLGLVFFLLVTPVGLVRRWLGYDPLQLRGWRRGPESVFKVRDHLYTSTDIARPY